MDANANIDDDDDDDDDDARAMTMQWNGGYDCSATHDSDDANDGNNDNDENDDAPLCGEWGGGILEDIRWRGRQDRRCSWRGV